MRRTLATLGAWLIVITLVGSARAQDAAPDVPAGPGAIRGQLMHEAGPGEVGGIDVILYALTPDGSAGLRRTTSDATGAFAFEGVSNDPGTVYLVGARVGDVPFGTRTSFEPGETERRVELALQTPTSEVADLAPGAMDVRLERGCTHLRIHHTHALANDSKAVVFIPAAEREGRAPLLEIATPAGATGFEAPLGGDGLEWVDGRVRFWGPLYPGVHEIVFTYGLPLAAETQLRFGLPAGASPARILAPRDAVIRGAALTAAEEVELDLGVYASWEAAEIGEDGSLDFTLVLPEIVGAEGLRISTARLWLEVDDAVVDVSEQHHLAVPTEISAPVRSEAPLLCLSLPADTEALRFSSASLDLGLSRDPSGALAIHGPLPAGEVVLGLRYRLPVRAEPIEFTRRFPVPVDLLALLVSDTGLLPETDDLHRRRPVRSEDRNYMHLEAYAVAPEQPISLRLRRLERGGPPPRLASAGLVLMVALAALGFLAAPLRAAEDAEDAEAVGSTPEATEREALYRTIADLDEDFETGKVSAEDHTRMRASSEPAP